LLYFKYKAVVYWVIVLKRFKIMPRTRFEIINNKITFYIEEIKSLKDAGMAYFFGFGLLIILLIPVFIIELSILSITGKDLGWFQSSAYVEKRATPGNATEFKMENDSFLNNYDGQTVEELIQLQQTHRVDSLVLAFESALEARRDAGEKLNEIEHTILAVEALEREVNNGGFSQFFYNSSVEYTPIIVTALKNIGCFKIADLTQKAIDILGVDSLDPDTIEHRMDPGDEALLDALGELDEIYFDSDEINEAPEYALFEYIKTHRKNIKLA
jgi:hypothetical protein